MGEIGKSADLIKQGIKWRLGTGTSILFWLDDWSPFGPLLHHTIAPVPQSKSHERVNYYLNEIGWNLAGLSLYLPDWVLQGISYMLPDLSGNTPDARYWRHTKDGIYTIKSATTALTNGPLWPGFFVWKLQVPPRTQAFLWLLLHGRLLTNDYRRRISLASSAECLICRNGNESITHVFCECPNAMAFWNQSYMPPIFFQNFKVSTSAWLLQNLRDSTAYWQGIQWNCIFAMLLWFIWKARCNTLFQDSSSNHYVKVSRICTYYHDWYQANHKPQLLIREERNLTTWQRPDYCYVKLNADAGCSHDGRATIGGVLRNHQGKWIVGYMEILPKMTILEAEMRAILTGLLVSRQHRVTNIIVESDCKDAVDLLQTQALTLHPLLAVRNRCHTLLSEFQNWQVKHVYREANQLAHQLAALAKATTPGLHVLYNPPAMISNIIVQEAQVSM